MISPPIPALGFNPTIFWSLSGRLVPCGPTHLMIAVDLSSRFVFWDVDMATWDLIPDSKHPMLFRQIRAWQAIAWNALQQLKEFFSKGEMTLEGSAAYERFFAIQYTFMSTQSLTCAWQRGWLYRSLCLDHRWLLREIEVPLFDEFIFSIFLLAQPGTGGLDHETQAWLRKDPIISSMPALHEMVYPDSWKTQVLLDLHARGLPAALGDVEAAINQLTDIGRFTTEQGDFLRAWSRPLGSSAVAAAQQAVFDQTMEMLLDISVAAKRREYRHFRMPTLDQCFLVYPPE